MGQQLSAYAKRMVNNHNKLLEFAEQLKKVGCKVYAVGYQMKDNDTIDYIHVRKDNLSTIVGFMEVPYRWYIGNPYSGVVRGIPMGETGYDIPFTVEEVLTELKPSKKLDSMYVEI